jgi:very-short-patch-repair endonuclease
MRPPDDHPGVAVIRREAAKKRGHKSLRKLLGEAGAAVQALRPVFMMSPISVAQFLEPGAVEFDLLIIDEASQVRPVEALGSIARARQIVVVGDDKQLPPTNFFDVQLERDEDESAEDQGVEVGDLESVLGLCCAQGLTTRMLRWHYRSQHESLIAVSNREFYDSKLFIVPSPAPDSEELGLHFRHIANGHFDRGGARTNREEARAVAQRVIDHAERRPHETLGVGAFSVAQRDAVLDELEVLRRQRPQLEPFFAESGAEPFFVKNLENIQGDERDVIFISIGYARDKSGYMAMSFGPLQRDGGERRLNVLISRARKRCEVFSSITADDVDLERARSRGAAALKTFLKYAQHRILDVASATGRDYDSEFERQVGEAVRGLGYEVDSQVGIAGFFIDLAVKDPAQPGRYLLGIECDGAAYHSSRSARDRDRLRQAVLEDRGWTIHRIWSTDWFQRPEDQLRRTLAAIEHARYANGSSPSSGRRIVGVTRDSGSIAEPYKAIDLENLRS